MVALPCSFGRKLNMELTKENREFILGLQHFNTAIEQPWARTELEWEIAWELMVLLAWVWITMPLSVESSYLATGGSMSC